ncbi:MAG TPA: hypothetical protein VFQ22_14130 [Longimicrobiales bacterium]|nr:hypothetical protein [Longimicrobiales bacterium]
MKRVVLAGAWLALALGGGPAPARAQTGERLVIGLSAAHAEGRLAGLGAGEEELAGPLFGAEVRATLSWLHLRAEYREGHLERGDRRATPRVASGRIGVGVSPFDWLAVTVGPRFFQLGTLANDRWITRWRVDVHGTRTVLPGLLDVFASVGSSLAGTEMDWNAPFGGGSGGELGVRVGGDGALWSTLGYRVDREVIAGGGRQATETIYLAFGVAMR